MTEKELSVQMIKNINEIPGFDPDLLAKDGLKDGETIKYLPVGVKKSWARMKFPHCVVRYPVVEFTNGYAHVIARFYEDKNDPCENYIGEGETFEYPEAVSPDKPDIVKINDAIVFAKGKAASKALAEAGFGLSFYMEDFEKEANLPTSPDKKVTPLISSDSTDKTKKQELKNGSGRKPKEISFEDAKNIRIDVGSKFVAQNMTLGEASAEELLWIYNNSSSKDVKKGILSIAKNLEDVKSLFLENGYPV